MQHNARTLNHGILGADTLWIGAALALTCGTRSGFAGLYSRLIAEGEKYGPILAFSIIAWWVIYRKLDLDGFKRGWQWSKLLSEITVGIALLAGVVSSGAFLINDLVPRSLLLEFAVLLGIGFVCIRAVAYFALSSPKLKPSRRVVIVGNGKIADELLLKFQRHPEMRCQVVGFMYPAGTEASCPGGQPCDTHTLVQDFGALPFLRDTGVTDVILALSEEGAAPPALQLAARCREAGMRVSVVPRTYELYAARPSLMDIDGLPILFLDQTSPDRFVVVYKRIFDIVLVFLSMPIAVPLLLLSSAYLKITTGTALKREQRCGHNGQLFWMYRLNLQRHGAAGFHQLLNNLSITDLPQLWNVLRGDMSVVGPRPESPERVRCYSEWQRQRLSVRPGLTGLAQVHGLREEHSSEDKARFDLQYIVSFSPLTDCILVLETVWTLLKRPFTADRRHKRDAFESAPISLAESRQC